MVDPIQQLAHDHRELNGLLLAVHAALTRIERGMSSLDDELHELQDGVEGFREALLDHFAREQEGLFPFVVARLPPMRTRADLLVTEHDDVATLLSSIARALATLDDAPALDRRGALARWQEDLERFETMYAAHARAELAFLDEVATSLIGDPTATEQLRALLEV